MKAATTHHLHVLRDPLVTYLVHDLKSPVAAIDLLAETVLRDRAADERARLAATKIRDEAHVLLRMISCLLDIEDAAEQRLVPVLQEVELHALVRDVFDELRPRARAARVGLAAELAVASWLVDLDLMRRVLVNLVDNAIRYAPEDSWIEVEIRTTTNAVELRVADSGPGIPSQLREAVFEPFNRGVANATHANHGLGLTFCKLAVEAHGGRIWIEDHCPGSVACIQIPASLPDQPDR